MKRYRTDYPGIFYREGERITGKGKRKQGDDKEKKLERIYYVVYKKNGKVYEEKAGRQYADDMSASKANNIRAQLIEGKRKSRPEIRKEEKTITEIMTIKKIWDKYIENNAELKGLAQDKSRFNLHIEPSIGKKQPSELVPLDVDRIRIKLSKTAKPGSVKHVLELLRRIINYAGKKQLCAVPPFKIEMPVVNNLKTEDLNEEQMDKLLTILRNGIVIEKDGTETLLDIDAREAMLLALITGMRRSEIFKLMWADVDFQRDFINIKDPKGVKDQIIPLSDAARGLLKQRTATKGSLYVFPGRKKGAHRVDAAKQFRLIRAAAGLSKDFRPMHGLRHTFASGLASSGEVDLYTLQRLLTHKSPAMTMRYAHLRDETLRKASNLAGNIIDQAAKGKEPETETATA
jgi:integrase